MRRDPEPEIWLSPEDAEARQITAGDKIEMYNEASSFQAKAKVTEKIPTGTLWIHDGWPGLNDLTNAGPSISDEVAKLFPFTTGQAGYDAFVDIRPI